MAPIDRLTHVLRQPSARQRLAIAAAIAVLATLFLISTSLLYGRYLSPVWHDEFAYATQIRMLAEFRLWMPPHPVGEFFETFYVLHQPKYAAQYFPGTALLLVPSVWLGIPLWIAEAAVAGVAAGLLYLVVAELLTPLLALLGAVLFVSSKYFQLMAVMTMAQLPVLLLGLALVYAFLQWRKQQQLRWAVPIGALAGWAAITRPLDAVCYAVPVGIAMLWEVRRVPLARAVVPALVVVAAAVPFLALQIAFNIGVTGSALTTPWEHYSERDVPGGKLGFYEFDPTLRVQSQLPQKQIFYERFIKPYLQTHDVDHLGSIFVQRLRGLGVAGLPHWSLGVLALLGVFDRQHRRRWVLAGSGVLFLLLYIAYPFLLTHYAFSMAPAMIVLVLSGITVLARMRPQHSGTAMRALVALLLLICIAVQPGVAVRVRAHELEYLSLVDRTLESIDGRAVVLFTASPRHSVHAEPVFNATVSWPDDARIVRAHDLGERNVRIFRYYAERQPERRFYRFDEQTYALQYLGTARQLAHAPGGAPNRSRPPRTAPRG